MVDRFIVRLSGLADLGEAEVHALERLTVHRRTFGSRQDLVRDGDKSGPVMIVLKGWAFRYKLVSSGDRQVLSFLMPGDGSDFHMLPLATTDHGIQTATGAVVAFVPRADLLAMSHAHPAIADAMRASQLVDRNRMRASIVSIGRLPAIQRAAHLLLDLFERAARVGLCGDGEITLPLSQELLADALGMTSIHLNRVLQIMRRCGALKSAHGKLCINNPAALNRISSLGIYRFERGDNKRGGDHLW